MKMHNSCFKNNHKPNGVVIRDAAEGAFLLSCPVLSSRVFLFFSFSLCVLVPSQYSLWTCQQRLSFSLPQLAVQL